MSRPSDTSPRVAEPKSTAQTLVELTDAATAILGSVDLLRLSLDSELPPAVAAEWREGLERIEVAGRRVTAAVRRLAEASVPSRPARPEVVLLCDDDESVRQITGEMLRNRGFTVVEAKDAESALAQTTALEQSFDLLVADLGLPTDPGDVLARNMVERDPQLRVLLISGRTPDRETGFAFLQKPFDSARLFHAVERVLAS